MSGTKSQSRKRAFAGLVLVGIALSGIIVGLVFNPVIDRRPAPPGSYAVMNAMINNPTQNGIDLTPMLPLIREAMENGHVYMGEWKRIMKAYHDLEREHARAKLQDILR